MVAGEVKVQEYGKPEKTTGIQERWWNAKPSEDKKKLPNVHEPVWGVLKAIRSNQAYKTLENLRYARLYANKDFDPGVSNNINQYFGHRISLNVVKSCVDTASAKIGKAKPRPLFLTQNGSFTQQRRAKDLTQYLDGAFERAKVYDIGKKIFTDACVFGLGIMKIFKDDDKVSAERVFPEELVVDDIEGRDGCPRQMHQQKLVSKDLLAEKFPDSKEEINKAKSFKPDSASYRTAADMIIVAESWHLKSGPNAKDGRHSITIESCTLFDEKYEKDYFPFAFMRWSESLLGFNGDGLASELAGIQLEISEIMQRIKEAMETVAIPRVFIETGSQVNSDSLTDEIGGLVYYSGQQPVFQTPVGMGRETYEYLEYLFNKAYAITGLSKLSASATKPAGLDSKVALREYQDIETDRFSIQGERYQNLYLDVARIFIDLSRDLYSDSPNLSVKVKGRKFLRTIKWKDVDLEDDQYIMGLFPTSLLPRTPEGKLQFAQELVQSGFIDKEEVLPLLDFPDLEGFFALKTAALDDIKFIIERMIEEGEYTPPEPYMDLVTAIKVTQSTYLRGKTQKIPEDRMELLRRFMDDCEVVLTPPDQTKLAQVGATTPQTLSNAGTPAVNPAQAPGSIPGPIAAPAQPPKSDLLPYATAGAGA